GGIPPFDVGLIDYEDLFHIIVVIEQNARVMLSKNRAATMPLIMGQAVGRCGMISFESHDKFP
ncbi:MAG: hypothetical protein NZU63_04465, partial [Gemmataceae bacterium]|nr:hypothetical protein [Gemmataceae bacterium]